MGAAASPASPRCRGSPGACRALFLSSNPFFWPQQKLRADSRGGVRSGQTRLVFPPQTLPRPSPIFSAGFAVCPSAHPGSSPSQAPLALPASPPKCSAPRARIHTGGHPWELRGRGDSGAPQPLPPAPRKSTSELWLSSSPRPAGFLSCFGGCCWNIKAASLGQSLPGRPGPWLQREAGAAKRAPELAPGLASSLVLSEAFAGEQNAARGAQGAPQPLVQSPPPGACTHRGALELQAHRAQVLRPPWGWLPSPFPSLHTV